MCSDRRQTAIASLDITHLNMYRSILGVSRLIAQERIMDNRPEQSGRRTETVYCTQTWVRLFYFDLHRFFARESMIDSLVTRAFRVGSAA